MRANKPSWAGTRLYQETLEETRAGGTALMEGRMLLGSSISLEAVQMRWEVENLSLGMTLHNINPLT